jgi:hypothetical protein
MKIVWHSRRGTVSVPTLDFADRHISITSELPHSSLIVNLNQFFLITLFSKLGPLREPRTFGAACARNNPICGNNENAVVIGRRGDARACAVNRRLTES